MTTSLAMDNACAPAAEALTRDQFQAFYSRTARPLRSYICRVLGNATAADDILQDSYIRLLNAPPLAEARRKSYLYRTATNLIADYRRTQDRNRRFWRLFPPRREAEESGTEMSSDIDRLLSRLGVQDRALLWLAYVEGASHREIGEILGVGEASVKVLLFRARRKMEALLREHGFKGQS